MSHPLDPQTDLARLRPRVCAIDDDKLVLAALAQHLGDECELTVASSGRVGLSLVRQQLPDLVLLDASMPDMDGFSVCSRLKAEELTREIPVAFLTRHVDEDWELRALALGAADFITKPLRPAVLLARIRNLVRERRLTTELRRLAQADGLTGLANRRQFDEVLRSELVRGRRQRAPLCLLMIDVDHFKAYNDRLGHLAGDQALCRVAAVLEQACQRAGDLACRYGGEEFALILPATDEQGGQHVAQAVRAAVQALALPHPGSPLGRLSVSLGVAVERSQGAFRPPADSQFGSLASGAMVSLVERADAALYRAKHLGRDQVVVARPEADQPAPTGWRA